MHLNQNNLANTGKNKRQKQFVIIDLKQFK